MAALTLIIFVAVAVIAVGGAMQAQSTWNVARRTKTATMRADEYAVRIAASVPELAAPHRDVLLKKFRAALGRDDYGNQTIAPSWRDDAAYFRDTVIFTASALETELAYLAPATRSALLDHIRASGLIEKALTEVVADWAARRPTLVENAEA